MSAHAALSALGLQGREVLMLLLLSHFEAASASLSAAGDKAEWCLNPLTSECRGFCHSLTASEQRVVPGFQDDGGGKIL